MWQLNSILLNNQWVKGGITVNFKMNDKENTMSKLRRCNMVLRRKFIPENTYIKKEERSRINKLLPSETRGKKEQTKHLASKS